MVENSNIFYSGKPFNKSVDLDLGCTYRLFKFLQRIPRQNLNNIRRELGKKLLKVQGHARAKTMTFLYGKEGLTLQCQNLFGCYGVGGALFL